MAKLREAVEVDKQNLLKKKPALEKLKLLPLIQKFMANFLYQKTFLNEGGLELIQDFIKKNKDGTYPALNQITTILDILSNLQITLQHLQNCQIGGYVMDISKNFHHSKAIQKKASEIVEKWSRIVWGINTNYNDIDTENLAYQRIYLKKRKREEDEGSSSEEEGEEKKGSKTEERVKKEQNIYSHARIPKKGLFDFTVKPVSNLVDNKGDDLSRLRYSYFDKKNSKK
jgi:transcription factor SPN1